MKVALIPCAPTEWSRAGRLMGRVALEPLSADGPDWIEWVESMRAARIGQIYHAPDELSTAVGRRLAKALGVGVRKSSELDEVDLGLWSGLTDEQLEVRYAAAHEQLCEAPLSVQPPEGEPFVEAFKRIQKAAKARLKRNGHEAIGFVMRPISLALMRYALQHQPGAAEVWRFAASVQKPLIVEPEGSTKMLAS